MKKRGKLSIKVRDLEPLKDIPGGMRRHHAHHRLQSRTRTHVWDWNPYGTGKWDYP
jgi:hypothetical protein